MTREMNLIPCRKVINRLQNIKIIFSNAYSETLAIRIRERLADLPNISVEQSLQTGNWYGALTTPVLFSFF